MKLKEKALEKELNCVFIRINSQTHQKVFNRKNLKKSVKIKI